VLGSGGNVYAGPRVRVRRGRIGKFPVHKACDGQFAVLYVTIWGIGTAALHSGISYQSRGHRGPPGRWSGMPALGLIGGSCDSQEYQYIQAYWKS
jgi:hypothetical protein